MNKKSGTSKDAADKLVRGIKRKTRKHYSAEEKIRVVLAGLRGEDSIAALCRREGIAESLYYSWSKEFLWPWRFHERLHISTRQYARIVRDWVTSIGLEASAYGTHSMRRTKVTQIYKKTGNLRAVQLLLGHTKMDSTVRYLGIELEDALAIAEAIEI